MFTFPQIVSLPILSSLGSGAALWPTAGGVIAWMLLAALVGSALGILRDATNKKGTIGRVSYLAPGDSKGSSCPSVDIGYTHREAA